MLCVLIQLFNDPTSYACPNVTACQMNNFHAKDYFYRRLFLLVLYSLQFNYFSYINLNTLTCTLSTHLYTQRKRRWVFDQRRFRVNPDSLFSLRKASYQQLMQLMFNGGLRRNVRGKFLGNRRCFPAIFNHISCKRLFLCQLARVDNKGEEIFIQFFFNPRR